MGNPEKNIRVSLMNIMERNHTGEYYKKTSLILKWILGKPPVQSDELLTVSK
jgi:hypothetical protein